MDRLERGKLSGKLNVGRCLGSGFYDVGSIDYNAIFLFFIWSVNFSLGRRPLSAMVIMGTNVRTFVVNQAPYPIQLNIVMLYSDLLK